ncbi:DUF3797 domain-containing protein [Paenibacillus sabinae]|uniref:DUF3797 domain-containing protein n=1 Tax=Paenibacillus sabinae T27 TaxID=1268072 RepID=X4ZHD3_9BACL|nr:DUF3797 domain-containing protein [Paenibacillus sabinae]AHV96145.1 hypothetical protein PSAB_06045 [Paenibacillus sabinae T27]
MDIIRAVELSKQYAACPECGNIYVNNGEGTIRIDKDSFYRSCKCGWSVTINDEKET